MSTYTYKLLSSQIESDSRNAFAQFANAIQGVYRYQVYSIFEANRALSRAISTAASEHEAEFPYFAIPSFEAKAHEARIQAGFEVVVYGPVAPKIEPWLEFAQASRGWLDESKVMYDALEPGQNRSDEPATPMLPDAVYDYVPSPTNASADLKKRTQKGFFLPSLHVSPPPVLPAGVYPYQNVNMFSNPVYKDISLASVELKGKEKEKCQGWLAWSVRLSQHILTVLTCTADSVMNVDSVFSPFDASLVDFVDIILGTDRHEASHQGSDFYESNINFKRQMHPHSIISQPVYKALLFNDNSVVGYLYSIITWHRYLENLLPEGVQGIRAVLRNSCNQSVTYELEGPHAHYLGEGDIVNHDQYDDQKVTVDFSDNYFDPNLTSSVPGHCQIFLDLYPSETFEESYASNVPVMFSIAVAVLFLIQAFFFLAYDQIVQYRNTRLVGHAAVADSIVTAMFPSQVRDRLLQEAAKKTKNGGGGDNNNNNSRIKEFTSNNNTTAEGGAMGDIENSPPIASLYTDTTILFADIVGK